LNKYNGYDFKVYKHDEKDINSIANNYIVDLQQDDSGNIWVGTADGLSKINTENDKITNYFSSEKEGNLSHNNIGDILITKDNKVLVGTSNGLNLYDEANDKFIHIFYGENDLSSQLIHTLEQDSNGDIWVATKLGLNKIDISENKVYKFYSSKEDKNTISENNIYGLYYDDNGYIWAGTFEQGLNRIDINTNEVTRFKHDPNNEKSISSNYIRDIFKGSNETIWIATDKGLAKFNEKDETFTTYKSNTYKLIISFIIQVKTIRCSYYYFIIFCY